MKPTSQQYAILSNEGYVDHKVGKRGPGERERVDVGGESYEILEKDLMVRLRPSASSHPLDRCRAPPPIARHQ